MSLQRTLVGAWLVLIVGCGGSTSPRVDASHDAMISDAITHDATTHDATTHDATVEDAASHDAAAQDATSHDATVDDAAVAVSCDRRSLTCRVGDPVCPDNHVPQIIDHCFGPCVPIDQCGCTEAAACPHEEMYTCHMYRQRCGPYVN